MNVLVPKLSYAEVWEGGAKFVKQLEAVQMTAAKKVQLHRMLRTTIGEVVTPLLMGAESCEKSESLQTFFATFLMYALYGSKKLRKKFGNFHFRQ